MLRRGRHRLRIALAMALCLLFQQVAIAAYACTEMPAAPVAMAADCAEMGMDIPEAATPICADHCTPDAVVAPEAGSVHVPPLALPALRFADVDLPPGACLVPRHDVPVDRSDPPPRLRYCSLLI